MSDDDNTTLSTGRSFYAHGGIVGIGPDGGFVGYGYDGEVEFGGEFYSDDATAQQPWTQKDRIALADMMIARWQAFKDRA